MIETKAVFTRKDTEIETTDCVVDNVIHLSGAQFDSFSHNLLQDWDFIRDNPIDTVVDAQGRYHCLLVLGEGRREGILVNSEGSSYARKSAFMPGAADMLENDRYPALADLNQKLKTAAEFIVELGYTGNPTNKYAIEISVVENEYNLRLDPGSQLFDTLIRMVADRPEIDEVHFNPEEILVDMNPDVLKAEMLQRDMDENAPFEVFIVSNEVGADGKSAGDWLPLPASVDDLVALLGQINVQATEHNVFHVADFRSLHQDICKCFSKNDSLDELNMAASFLANTEDFEWDKLHAILAGGGLVHWHMPRDAAALINMMYADNFDGFDLIGASNHEQLGHYWDEEKPERFNHEEYGRIVQREEQGSFTKWGYIHFKYKEPLPCYNGIVSEEYRITDAALNALRSREAEYEKPSVMDKIREARKNPAPPKADKAKDKDAPGLDL